MHPTTREAVFLKSLRPDLSLTTVPHPSKGHVRSRFKPVNHSSRDGILTTADPNTHEEVASHKFTRVIQYFTKPLKQNSQEAYDYGATRGLSHKSHDDTILLHVRRGGMPTSARDFWRTVDEDFPSIEPKMDPRQTTSVASSIRLDIYDAFASMQTFDKASDEYCAPPVKSQLETVPPRFSSSWEENQFDVAHNLDLSKKDSHNLTDENINLHNPRQRSRRAAISRLFGRVSLLGRGDSVRSKESKDTLDISYSGTDSLPKTEFVEVRERGSGRPDLLSFWCTSNELNIDGSEPDLLQTDHKIGSPRVTYKALAKLHYFDPLAPVSHACLHRISLTASRQLLARRTLRRVWDGTIFCNTYATKRVGSNVSVVGRLALRVKVNPQREVEHAEIERIKRAREQGTEENHYGEQRFGTRCDHSDWYRHSQVVNYYEKNRT